MMVMDCNLRCVPEVFTANINTSESQTGREVDFLASVRREDFLQLGISNESDHRFGLLAVEMQLRMRPRW